MKTSTWKKVDNKWRKRLTKSKLGPDAMKGKADAFESRTRKPT